MRRGLRFRIRKCNRKVQYSKNARAYEQTYLTSNITYRSFENEVNKY